MLLVLSEFLFHLDPSESTKDCIKGFIDPVRSHKDLDKDAAPYFKKAIRFYDELGKQLVHQGHALDVFASALDQLRESKGLPTIRFCPHCGEIGLAMSPHSNNSLFLDYHRNPFPMFFQRGLNVSLSKDDPLQIHLTKEPLVEEYSVAAMEWRLSSCDLSEIARNFVYQSGFPHAAKVHWLGDQYFKRGPQGNVTHKANVSSIRILFRYETWESEMQNVYSGKARLPEEFDH